MEQSILNQLIRLLEENGLLKSTKECVETKEEISLGQLSPNEIGVASDGTPYVKQQLFDYLTERNYSFNLEAVDLFARKFPYDPLKPITEVKKTYVTHTELDDYSGSVSELIQLKSLEVELAMYKLLKQDIESKKEYAVETVTDTSLGEVNAERIGFILQRYGECGWRLREMYSNELGRNVSSAGLGGFSSGSNSTICQTVLVFERNLE